MAKISPDQPIFSTSVAADLLGLHPRTLRLYESAGFVVPARSASNRRQYSQNDLKLLALTARLIQEHGVNMAGVKVLFAMLQELRAQGVDPDEALTRALVREGTSTETQ